MNSIWGQNVKRVLFVNSVNFSEKYNNFSNGLFSLGTVLKKAGYDVNIIDFDYLITVGKIKKYTAIDGYLEEMCNYLLDFNPDVICLYTMSNSFLYTINLAKLIKKINRKVKVLFGGPQATLCATETLNLFQCVDAIGIGEGERTIELIINALLLDKDLTNIRGVAYLKDGEVKINDTDMISDLDLLEKYDFSLFDGEMNGRMSLDVGRGCPFGCKYCSTKTFWKRKFRLKSSNRIIEEMIEGNKKFNVTQFDLQHDLFTANRKKVIEFCNKLIELKLVYEWTCSARVDTLDEELISIMSTAGCKAMFLGVETGSKSLQRIINKNLNLDKVSEVVKGLKKNNIKVITSFIYGFPEETESDLNDTLELIYNLVIDKVDNVQCHLFSVFPGTEYMNELKESLYYSEVFSDLSSWQFHEFNNKNYMESNKEIFSQYLDFDLGVRKDVKGLDRYIFIYFKTFIKHFSNTYNYLRKISNSHVNIFKTFREANSEVFNKECSEINGNSDIKDLCNKIYKLIGVVNDELLTEIFNFEIDIITFMYFSDEINMSKTYEYDVYRIKRNKLTNYENLNRTTKIQYTRLNDKYNINIKKVV